MDRVERARTVGVRAIAAELGWSRAQADNRLHNHLWMLRRLRKANGRWDAHVIDVLRQMYGQAPEQSKDFLAAYLKEIE